MNKLQTAESGVVRSNILLVDDIVANLTALQAVLQCDEYNLVCATSGTDALRQILEHEFAVIILDVHMPEMDGFETAILIRGRESYQQVPIVFISASAPDDSKAERAYQTGAIDYLTKPFSAAALRAKVASLVAMHDRQVQREKVAVESVKREFLRRQHELEDLYHESQTRFEVMIECLPGMVWTAEPDGRIDFYNKRWSDYTGGYHEHLDTGWKTVVHPDDLLSTIREWEAAVASGLPFMNEVRLRRKEGDYRWHLVRAAPFRGKEGKILKWFGTTMDIHEHKQVVEKLQQERELRESFVRALTHDLRAPLTTIKASAQMIERALITEKPQRHLQRITASVDRADHMIQDLLDANCVHAGNQLAIRRQKMDLCSTIRDAVDELSLRFNCAFHIDAPESIYGVWCPTSVRRIIDNLGSNAAKYGLRGAPVTVVARVNDQYATLTVHNEGPALTQDEQENMFRLFHRGESAMQSKQKGWGIGLPLVRGLVEAHRGKISVRSAANQGTTFVITLPLRE